MTATVQLNTRIDSNLKRGGDAVFSRFELTPSEVIRSVWQYAVDNQAPPDFVSRAINEESNSKLRCVRESAGMAARLAGLSAQQEQKLQAMCASSTRDSLRDELYDSLLDEVEAHHA